MRQPLAAATAAFVALPLLATVVLASDPTVIVESGDTLTHLARRHGTDIGTLVELNRLENPNRIYIGQRLRIAAAAATAAATEPPPAAVTPRAAAPRSHVVAAGENLTRIARRYGVTIAAIVAANRIDNPSRIFVGQRLRIDTPSSTARARAPMAAEMRALVAKREEMRRLIVAEADRYGVPPALALAVAWQESGWRQGVVSHAGAVGVMQLMPATAVWVGDVMLGAPVKINDARSNVRAGVRLLAHYLDRYDGNRDRVLAAYYQGQWATDHNGIYDVSRPYIASIKLLEDMFGS